MARGFDRLRFVLPASQEAGLVAELWGRGTLGLQLDTAAGEADAATIGLEAWFPAGKLGAGAFAHWRARGVTVSCQREEQTDPLAAYREAAQPVDIGECFRVDPRDPHEPDAVPEAAAGNTSRGRWTLRIPARTAFGTGSHETTRLMLWLLESLELAGCSVLDVGTGSGILSFAALRLGARRVIGFDLDASSALVAGQNRLLNPWPEAPRFFAGRFSALRSSGRFDRVLVNVLPERIRGDRQRLVRCLAPAGQLVSAGALVADRREQIAGWRALGLAVVAEQVAGAWVAWVLARQGAPR